MQTMIGFGDHPGGCNDSALQNEIRVLENRILVIEDMGNSAYERLLIRTYSNMVEQRKELLIARNGDVVRQTPTL